MDLYDLVFDTIVESAVENKPLTDNLLMLYIQFHTYLFFFVVQVQNADDNTYPTYVEPTLTFILQDSGIIVLNNEQGFSAENIRALCDVGSSTKKGSNAGYIGRKGIGFKSVFRVGH